MAGRGGKRPGAGRPKMPQEERDVRAAVKAACWKHIDDRIHAEDTPQDVKDRFATAIATKDMPQVLEGSKENPLTVQIVEFKSNKSS